MPVLEDEMILAEAFGVVKPGKTTASGLPILRLIMDAKND